MALLADELRDLRLDGNRQVQIGQDGDLELTSGIETVEQSVMLNVGDEIKPLIGEPLNGTTYEDIQATIEDALSSDPQLESVNRVGIETVNTSTGKVTVEVFTEFNNSFTINIPT